MAGLLPCRKALTYSASFEVHTAIILILTFIPIILIAQESEVQSPTELKKLSFEELMNIKVTSVSRKEELLYQTASAIQVITQDDMRRFGVTSIPEALRLAGNLHVAQKNSHDWAISARGFNTDLANKLLVLIDGRTVYTPLFSGVFWDRQDYLMEDIERIEVISGPGGTLWGSNAVNGVVNIITKKAGDTKGLYAEGGGGTQFRDFVGLRYGGAISRTVDYRVYGKYFDRDDAAYPDGEPASDSWRMGQTGIRCDAEISSKNFFTVQGDYYEGRENISTGGKSTVRGGNIVGRWTHTISPQSKIKFQLYYDHSYLLLPVPATMTADNSIEIAPAGELKDDLNTYDLDFQHSFHLGKRHSLVWGLGYRRMMDKITNAPALAFVPETLGRNLYSCFVQDVIVLFDKLLFTLGSKIEHNDYTQFEFEPSMKIQWNFNERQNLWAAASRAVRLPSRVDRHIRLPTPALSPFGIDNLLIGGEEFDSETVIAYELGHRGQLLDKVTWSVSLFYNLYGNIRSTSLSPPDQVFGLPFPLYYANNLEGENYGLELAFTWQVSDKWRLHGDYSSLHNDIRVRKGQSDFNNALNETADPRNRISLRSSLDLSKALELNAGLRWVDSFQYNVSGEPATVSSYAELDIRLAWRPSDDIEISITGQNLLDDQHSEYVVSKPNPRAEIKRGVYGKVAWRF